MIVYQAGKEDIVTTVIQVDDEQYYITVRQGKDEITGDVFPDGNQFNNKNAAIQAAIIVIQAYTS